MRSPEHQYFPGNMRAGFWLRSLLKLIFPGCSWHIQGHSFTSEEFGYRKYHSRAQLTCAIEKLWSQDLERNLDNGLSASVYTQLSDVEDETNGLMTYDREILKVDGETIRSINARLLDAFARIN